MDTVATETVDGTKELREMIIHELDVSSLVG